MGVPVELLTTPMPPVVISAGFVLLEMPMRPMSGMYDDREKLRSTWSSDFCSLYEPDMNAFQWSFVRSPQPAETVPCH